MVREDGLFTATLMSKNQDGIVQVDEVDSTFINQTSIVRDFNHSFTVFKPLVDLIALVIYKTCDKNFVALFMHHNADIEFVCTPYCHSTLYALIMFLQI